ncbi:MAG: PAS domain-containing protein [Alphaproteobacteria bacterium]|nr:PAS domain-containing protein [Alphaproteobacteria bacterium]
MDRALISRLAEDILGTQKRAALTALFAENGAPEPRLHWDPPEAELPEGPLRFLAGFWRRRRDGDALPGLDIVDPLALKPALGYLMLLDVLDDGWDYRYRIYGSEIAQRHGRDLTGRRTSDIARTAYTGLFYIAGYRAVLARRQPLFSVSSSPNYVAAVDWSRLALPLAGPDRTITRLLVGNVPGDWRPATEPLPPRAE